MKALFLPAILLILATCSTAEETIPPGFARQQLAFKTYKYFPGPKAVIRLYVPARFDTLLNWVDRSDAGGTVKNRFISSKGCLTQESGFVHVNVCAGEFDRLTIETYLLGGAELPNDTTGFAKECTQLEQAARDRVNQFIWHSKSIRLIHGRQFAIQEFFGSRLLGFDENHNAVTKPFEQLIARTQLIQGGASWLVTFRFECKQQECRDFSKHAYTVLNSIEIDTAASK